MTFSIYELNQILDELSLTKNERYDYIEEYKDIINEKNDRLNQLKRKLLAKKEGK